MKKCYTCGLNKEKSEFNKNKSRADGLNSICRECSNKRSKQYYRENTEKHKKNVSKIKHEIIEKNQKRIIEFLIENPCVLCKEKDILALDLDHLGNKNKEISSAIASGWSWGRIEQELLKCQVLCANCHRKKTHKENNSYKWRHVMGCKL